MRVVNLDLALLGVGVVDVLTIGLLLGSLRVAATPSGLRTLRRATIGAALFASLPFASSALLIACEALSKLIESGWEAVVSNIYLRRNLLYGGFILILGGVAMSAPAIAAWLTTLRLRSASAQLPPDWRALQKVALCCAGVVTLELLSAWQLGLWFALPLAVLALVLPGGLATLNVHRHPRPHPFLFTEPSRFTSPQPSNPPVNLRA